MVRIGFRSVLMASVLAGGWGAAVVQKPAAPLVARPAASTPQSGGIKQAAQPSAESNVSHTANAHEHELQNGAEPGWRGRAEAQAEAIVWMASGLSRLAYGDVSTDSIGPSYAWAQRAFTALQSSRAMPRH